MVVVSCIGVMTATVRKSPNRRNGENFPARVRHTLHRNQQTVAVSATTTIIGIVGSLRAGSVNGAAQHVLPDGAVLEIHPVDDLARLYPTIGFGGYGDRIDDGGELTDPTTLDELRAFLAGFVEHCRMQPPVADPA